MSEGPKRIENEYLEALKADAARLPLQSGVYRFLNKEGKVIYVGKAKNLKKRVAQYFQSERNKDGKTQVMVKKIVSIEHTIVDSESDALLLENNLIKELQPRYNILLKDDKTYPWICIKNEHFPRVFATRQKIKDGSRYFGPYTSGTLMYLLLDLIRQLFPLRNCKLGLTPASIAAGKYKICLQYHIGRCKGPCEGKQTEPEYVENIEAIADILNGKSRRVSELLKGKMKLAAVERRYEDAQRYKEQLTRLENYQSKSIIVHPSISNVDVFSLAQEEMESYVNFLRVVEGSIVQSFNLELKLGIEETLQDQLRYAVLEIQQRLGSLSPEVIVPLLPEIEIAGSHFHVPQRGDKLALLELSQNNAKAFQVEKIKHTDQIDPERSLNRVMQAAQKDLRMNTYPLHIECFDNSNLQGTHPVAACVVFKKGKPSKKDYRHFNIKTVVGPDDFASMQEVLLRRYSRLINEGQSLPQLIVVDGGKGQLSAACEVLAQLGLSDKITIVGLAKRLEEIYFPGDPDPLFLDKNSPTLRLLMQMRDEAHRFGITFHRNKRSSHFTGSQIGAIAGIGPEKEKQLLRRFKSIKGIKAATQEELAQVVGPAMAQKLREALTDLQTKS